jgi:preprotein translocase subunit SecG
MGFTVFFVIVFLAALGFLAFINSRKTSQELKRLNNNN